jgi:hypothetical protein
MNEHLEPAFTILFELERAGLDYWVYGGVSIAAYAGHFIRVNKDVDVFVENNHFERANSILKAFTGQLHYLIKSSPAKNEFDKPKTEIIKEENEIASIIPVYLENDCVKFKYGSPEKAELYPTQILEKIERNISGYRFFTPPDRFIKAIFLNHIKDRPGKKRRLPFRMDARVILGPEELNELNWVLN